MHRRPLFVSAAAPARRDFRNHPVSETHERTLLADNVADLRGVEGGTRPGPREPGGVSAAHGRGGRVWGSFLCAGPPCSAAAAPGEIEREATVGTEFGRFDFLAVLPTWDLQRRFECGVIRRWHTGRHGGSCADVREGCSVTGRKPRTRSGAFHGSPPGWAAEIAWLGGDHLRGGQAEDGVAKYWTMDTARVVKYADGCNVSPARPQRGLLNQRRASKP